MTYTCLVGDVGGTKTRLAVVEVTDAYELTTLKEQTYVSRQFERFDDMLAQFVDSLTELASMPTLAAFGIAGPIQGRTVRTTNLPWFIDADLLQQRFAWSQCVLLNDLESTAYGIAALATQDFCVLQTGAENALGNLAVIAAGTGLGEAGLFWDGNQHIPFATEGGHASFAPSDDLEMDLLKFLQQRYSHVSWERVVSGMGIVDIHQFLHQYHKQTVADWFLQSIREQDYAAVVADAALKNSDVRCVETMQLFIKLYAAEAGNLALKMMSRGGLYIGGGIAPKILPLLQSPQFMSYFLHKGRMSPLLEAMPVKVILNDRAALLGPALCVVRNFNR